MSKSKNDLGFSAREIEDIFKKNKTVYSEHNLKNPFKQTSNIDLFKTKISFKSIGLNYSRTENFLNQKKKLEQERDNRVMSQTSRQFSKGKSVIMNKIMQLHKKLENKRSSTDNNILTIQDNYRSKEIRFIDDNMDSKIVKNLNDNLNISLLSNQKSIIEELKILRESINNYENKVPKVKEKEQIKSLINFNRNNKSTFFITSNKDMKRRNDNETFDNSNNNINGRKIYFKQPLFNNRKVIVLNGPNTKSKGNQFPQIRVNQYMFSPQIIEAKPDIYSSWTIKDIRIFEKCILPRFRNY